MHFVRQTAAILAMSAAALLPSASGRAQDVGAPATAAPAMAARVAAQPAPGQRLAPGTSIPPAELEAFVDGVVRDAMAGDHIAGVSVSVVQNGEIALNKGYGFAGLDPARPVDPDRTLFRLGPLSDTFTWIVVMKEAEAGHLRLNAPINLFLPERLQIQDQGFKRLIYLSDLMTHSAGLEDRVFGHLFEDRPRGVRPLAVYLRQERPRRVREAGDLSNPTDYEVALAGEAASYVANKPFESLVESEITGPLGLTRTTFREPHPKTDGLPEPMSARLAADVSQGYHWSDGVFQPRGFEYASQIAPAEAGSSTAGDMARYMLMILGGGQTGGVGVYNASTAAGFRSAPTSIDPALNGWANGFRIAPLAGDFVGYGEDGGTLSFAAGLYTVPQLDLGVFVAANTDTGRRLAASLPGLIVAHFYAPPVNLPRPGSPDVAGKHALYAGDYLTTRRAYGGLEKFVDQLRGWIRVETTPDGWLLVSGPRFGAAAYAPNGEADHFRKVDGSDGLIFQTEAGRTRRIVVAGGQGAYEHTGLLNRVAPLALLACLTALASLVTLIGLITRDRREFRQTSTQRRADVLQTTIAVLWLVSVAGFAFWSRGMSDPANLTYRWPGALLMLSSACALVASVLTLLCIVIGPAVWRGGRRVDSWTALRKLGFTLNTATSALFAVLLFAWGALQPWSG